MSRQFCYFVLNFPCKREYNDCFLRIIIPRLSISGKLSAARRSAGNLFLIFPSVSREIKNLGKKKYIPRTCSLPVFTISLVIYKCNLSLLHSRNIPVVFLFIHLELKRFLFFFENKIIEIKKRIYTREYI